MSRLTSKMAALKAANRTALVPFITAGDPNPEFTLPALKALVRAGADIIEVGVPFSDPMADGPVIQKACERALKQGTRLVDLLDMVAEFRQTDTQTPIVLMGYFNPIYAYGVPAFLRDAKAAGADGLIAVDVPPEEDDELGGPTKTVTGHDRSPSLSAARSIERALRTTTIERIFEIGLHEFLTDFVESVNALGVDVRREYLLG